MRDVKFRAFHKDTKEMYSVDLISFKESYIESDDVLQPMLLEHVELMQFTGLKDKNGVEIFEGDILNEPVSPVGGKDGGYRYNAREIKWEGAGSGYLLYAPYAASEVIGNIHQNPELLK